MIRKTLNGGLHTLVGIAAAMLAVSVVLTTVNALARSFFHMNFPWVEELCCYLAALMMFVMMPSLEFRDEQLSSSFLDEKFKNNQVARQILFYIRGIVTVIFTGILINGGYKVVVRNLEIHSASPILRMPFGWLYGIILATMVLVIVYWVAHLFINEWRGRGHA